MTIRDFKQVNQVFGYTDLANTFDNKFNLYGIILLIDGDSSAADIARSLNINYIAARHIINGLVRMGYCYLVKDDRGRNRLTVSLTPKGQELQDVVKAG